MKRLILIDLSSIWWSAWHSSEDQEISAAYNRTIERVHSLRRDHDLVGICVDSPPYFRRDILPEYKAQREAHPPQALEQLERVKKRLAADGLLLWSAKGFEADDVIATAVRHAKDAGMDVTIASADKDLLQLVDDQAAIQVLSTASSVRYTREQVINKFGVDPSLVGDLLALVGDTSDNIPGVPSVGVKTAAKLLLEFGSLDEMFERADQITPPRIMAAIVENAETVRLARKCIALRDDVPIDWKEIFVERKPESLTDSDEDESFDDEPPPEEKPPAPKSEPPPAPAAAADAPEKPTSALVVTRPQEWTLALEPHGGNDAWKLSKMLFDSRLYQRFSNAQAIFAIILRGRSIGLDATTSLDLFHLIEGRPTMHASLMVGLVLKSGKADYFDITETSNERATWVTKRRGSKHEVKVTFSVDDALLAGLLERAGNTLRGVSKSGKPSNWDKYRRTMLRWRAATELARAVYPDVVAGLYTPDELTDGQSDIIDAEFEAA